MSIAQSLRFGQQGQGTRRAVCWGLSCTALAPIWGNIRYMFIDCIPIFSLKPRSQVTHKHFKPKGSHPNMIKKTCGALFVRVAKCQTHYICANCELVFWCSNTYSLILITVDDIRELGSNDLKRYHVSLFLSGVEKAIFPSPYSKLWCRWWCHTARLMEAGQWRVGSHQPKGMYRGDHLNVAYL